MIRMEQVTRENGDQAVVDGELDVPRNVVQLRGVASVDFVLEAIRNVGDGKSAPHPRVLIAMPKEQLCGGQKSTLVEALVDGPPGLGDHTTLVVRKGENTGYELVESGRRACFRLG